MHQTFPKSPASRKRLPPQDVNAVRPDFVYVLRMTDEQRKRLKRVMKDGLRIQDRFAAEPVYARTGKGYLRSEGVETLQKIKAGMKRLRPA